LAQKDEDDSELMRTTPGTLEAPRPVIQHLVGEAPQEPTARLPSHPELRAVPTRC
jgi:hypothetical protein